MPSGKEILDAIEFLKHGGPAAIAGLVLGCILYLPLSCGPEQCENLVGHQIEASGGFPTDFEWLKGIFLFIIVFTIAGWLLSAVVGLSKSGASGGKS